MRYPFDGTYTRTQDFGGNPQTYAQFGMKGHNGLDFAVPTGSVIVAAIDGKVVEVGEHPTGYGKYIKIENDLYGVLVAHLQKSVVNVGDTVYEGNLIGYSNNTGFSSGPHLHFGVFSKPRDRNNGYDGFIDPLPLLTVQPINMEDKKLADEMRKITQHNSSLKDSASVLKALSDKDGVIGRKDDEIRSITRAKELVSQQLAVCESQVLNDEYTKLGKLTVDLVKKAQSL